MSQSLRRAGPWPMAAERVYAAMLRRRVALLKGIILEQAEPILSAGIERDRDRVDALDPEALYWPVDPWRAERWYDGRAVLPVHGDLLETAIRGDVDQSLVAEFLALVQRIRGRLVTVFPVSADRMGSIANQVDRINARNVSRQLGQSVERGAVTQAQLRIWARENAALIQGMDARILDDLSRAVVRAETEGLLTRDLGKVLNERFAIARRKADLIGRDQVGHLNAQITRTRQMAAGFTRFRWRDSGDQRVRPLHEEIDGEVFDYPQGHPTEGIPGQPILCRCTATPVR